LCQAWAGTSSDGGALALAQIPADGVGQLVPRPCGQLVQAGDEVVSGPGAVASDHQPRPASSRAAVLTVVMEGDNGELSATDTLERAFGGTDALATLSWIWTDLAGSEYRRR
jgi:hypothetical protein